jgi:hypothetical protein
LQVSEGFGVAHNLGRRALVILVLTFVGWVDIGKFEFAVWRHRKPFSEVHWGYHSINAVSLDQRSASDQSRPNRAKPRVFTFRSDPKPD